jgi:hypothetical protein
MPNKPGVRGLLVDLDGVLYDSDRLVAGAVDTVRWLQTQGILHLFVTNTTSKSRAGLAKKLVSFGIPVGEDEILTPAVAAAEWLRVNGKGEIALFVRPSARLDFRDLPCLPDDAERGAAYVVLGDLGDLWDYRTLNFGWHPAESRWTSHPLWPLWSMPQERRRWCSANPRLPSSGRPPRDLGFPLGAFS